MVLGDREIKLVRDLGVDVDTKILGSYSNSGRSSRARGITHAVNERLKRLRNMDEVEEEDVTVSQRHGEPLTKRSRLRKGEPCPNDCSQAAPTTSCNPNVKVSTRHHIIYVIFKVELYAWDSALFPSVEST